MGKRIEIEKKDLKKLYVDQNKTTYDIAAIYGCTRKTISRLLKQYGIEIKRYKRKYAFYYEQNLNKKQIDLIIGSLLGDGCVAKHHTGINGCRFIESHSIKQLEYLTWKKDILENFVSNKIRFIDNSKNKSYGNGISCVFETVLHKDFDQFYNAFYKNKIKKVPSNIQLSPLSLFVWFCDDGSVFKNGSNSFVASFHTESFDKESIEILRNILKNKFSIKTFVVNAKNKYSIIRMNNANYIKFCDVVKEYTVPCMNYKIKFSDSPVETCSVKNGVSVLKCSGANTPDASSHKKMMV